MSDEPELDLLSYRAEGDPGLPLAAPSTTDATEEEKPPQLSLFEIDETWRELWRGMPEFVQKNLKPMKTIYVHFETREDLVAFSALVGQQLTMETRSIWYPEAERVSQRDGRYIDAPPDESPEGVEVVDLG